MTTKEKHNNFIDWMQNKVHSTTLASNLNSKEKTYNLEVDHFSAKHRYQLLVNKLFIKIKR